MEIIFLLVGVAILAALCYLGWRFFTKTETQSSPTEENQATPVKGLLELNLAIRKGSIGYPLTLLAEEIIDKLLLLTPKMQASGGDLSWTVNRIATEYLPNKCIHPYLSLRASDRVSPETMSAFENNLKTLKGELDEVEELIATNNQHDFNLKAKFLQQKFHTEGKS